MRPWPCALHRFAACTAAATFLLLVAGALVTSTDSGLAVPDWPLSYGMWFPPMVGGILYEHGHRMMAAVVAVMIVALSICLQRREPRRWVRRLGGFAVAAVLAQALLGGLTVLWLLPAAVSIAHACLGPAVFCLVALIARATAPRRHPIAAEASGAIGFPLWLAVWAVAGAATLQVVLGAVVRHTGAGLAWHVGGAVLITVATGWLLRGVRPGRVPSGVRSDAVRLGWLVAGQWGLGLAAWQARESIEIVTAHVALGQLLLGQSVIAVWRLQQHVGSRAQAWRRHLGAYAELTKPRVTALVLVTTAVGFWLGWRPGHSFLVLLPLLLGTAAAAGGANALNQWMERDADALMERTRHRPLPSARLTPEAARRFGLTLTAAGILAVSVLVNVLSAALIALTVLSYVGWYTPLKRRTSLCTLVGAIPGALPPVIGWAAARNGLGPEAVTLFALLFLWQLPHFLAIAMLYREDYARAGFQMLSRLEPTGVRAARQAAWSGLVLVPVSLMPTLMGLSGPTYFFGALLMGVVFLSLALRTALLRTLPTCRQLFLASVLYLPLLLALLAWDKVPA